MARSNKRGCRCRGVEILEPRRVLATFRMVELNVTDAATVASAFPTDFDSDGDQDILVALDVEEKIVLYENIDGHGKFSKKQLVDNAGFVNSVYAADLDGDGDSDVISAVSYDDQLAWYPNDGVPKFEQGQPVTDFFDDADFVRAADLDGDGDNDVLAASSDDDNIAWFENTDGQGRFAEAVFIASEAFNVQAVEAVDIDMDGDLDIASTDSETGEAAWYDNINGRYVAHPIEDTQGIQSIIPADFDLDGDPDLLLVSKTRDDERVTWHENTDGQGRFGPAQLITSGDVRVAGAIDVDGDGDRDVVAAGFRDRLFWIENEAGSFGASQPFVADYDNPSAIVEADLDGDTRPDVILVTRSRALWYQNRLFGDSNHDGQFDSSDLLAAFRHGKYEDGIPDNSTFEEGDWNDDGDFDSADLVDAFQAGHYESVAPAIMQSDIAAAVDAMIAEDENMSRSRKSRLSGC